MNSPQHPVLAFWYALNAYHRLTTSESLDEPLEGLSNPVSFNALAFNEAKRLGLTEQQMNSTISTWACTLSIEPPAYFLKQQNIQL